MPLFQAGNKSRAARSTASESSENETGRPGFMKRFSHLEGSRSSENRSSENVSPVRMSLLSRLRSGTAGSTGTSSSHPPSKEKENTAHNDLPLAVDIQIPKDESDNHHDSDTSPSPPSSSPPSFMGEPKQPTNIHDAMELALNTTEKLKSDISKHPHISHLTKWDLKHLFSGAPHFMLEKGRNDYWYPQVLFPWDLHVTTIQDLWDMQPLIHPSFTLSTLHAHLPVPDEWAKKGHTMMWKSDWRNCDVIRRASFDVGVFEFPNMLSMNGKEPGSVGFRYFLEMPVADNRKYKGPPVPKGTTDFQKITALPVSEAFHIMEHLSSPYSECSMDIVHDRQKLLMEGPPGWKRIGVRDFTIESVVKRLQELKKIRHEILVERSAKTVLDRESTRTMFDNLFTKFLYPPIKVFDYLDRYSLKTQIEVLTEVLATKGAWFDLSLTEWRMRIGQILWEMPPHPGGDYLSAKDCPPEHYRGLSERGLERKWLLLQILLAAELLLRVDAVVRVGILEESKDIILTVHDIERFDKLRSGKVDWDLILVRRFFDTMDVQHYQHLPVHHNVTRGAAQDRPVGRHGLLSRIGSYRHRETLVTSADPESAWDYVLNPHHPEKQLHGLLIFAQNIDWPGKDELKHRLSPKFESGGNSMNAGIYASPVRNTLPERYVQTLDKSEMYRKSPSRRLVLLQWPQNDSKDASSGHDVGGWMSRTWFSGLVLPGEAIGHFLIATVLENDPKAMKALGPLANLYGGFVYDDKSWWSKMSIVGRVLSCLDNTTGCMGWMKSHVVPRDVHTGELLRDTWLEVEMREVPQKSKKPRIQHGTQLSLQSTPLGIGALSSDTFSLPVDQPVTDTTVITFEGLFLSRKPEQETMQDGITIAKKAYVAFRLTDPAASKATILSFPLTYNTHFVSSYACLPPHGYATNSHNHKNAGEQSTATSRSSGHSTANRLPGHPLHTSYPYRYIPLSSLSDIGASALPSRHNNNNSKNNHNHKRFESSFPETWILDARGGREREAFARAWCASVGTSAVISRVGRTCIACSVREARAVDVGIMIRVGER
ncbi:hypothetical protein ANI_1_1080104 [Paecilomyces variotii No. 5]|uniref:Uncharacterized protein n=1 Tax=Byssochlamys spectabilis (strain No. 5 / NBRC 109023) TaxID=1356009 RepID=V5FLK3_BYSSN|nr:hypothetical protein ANI_1_1080104 [Paecilomyces variotii No. 5]